MRKLRSNYAIGSPHWAVRRAQWRALGLTDEDMAKPKIAVINSSSELAICFSHLDGVASVVKDAIRAAGGLPIEIRTTAPSDFIVSPGGKGAYILSSRDLIVNDIEAQVEGAQLDGMIALTSCDKTPPAHVMAAGRLNIPTLLVIGGYQPSGELNGEHVDIEDVFLSSAGIASGSVSIDHLRSMSENAVRGPGVCSGMGTANSMHIVVEALGMTLPGAAPVLANSPKMFADAAAAGHQIVEMVLADRKPRDILTHAAFRNAVATLLAVSGSINCIRHLQAIATESGVDIDIHSLVQELGQKVPMLVAVRPNGPQSIEALEAAGGANAVMKRIEPLLDTGALTSSGKSVAEVLEHTQVPLTEVVRPLDTPFSDQPAIVIVRGTLASESGIIKLGQRDPGRPLALRGPARVFENPIEAMAAINADQVSAGTVLVIRGMGLIGGPAMGGAVSTVVFTLYNKGLANSVAVVSDGQLSGLVNKGLVIGEISPESAIGGPLGYVEDGDIIDIDVLAGRIDLEVTAEVLADRAARNGPPALNPARGYLRQYRDQVQPIATGGVLTRG
ncbi:MAG: dihydroxy-acid dehydratase [Blastomonas fulva]|uniref:dihydroxy-acid dehydratase n=1 Tax=Blastomonas fulva TaxID=1550728 RepID=UPI003F6FE9FD